jgi:hypothetical protein
MNLALGDGIEVSLRLSSVLAAKAQLSPSELLRSIEEAARQARGKGTAFSDWENHALDRRDPASRADRDTLFVSYWQFCCTLQVEPLHHKAFCQALGDAGIDVQADGAGRAYAMGVMVRPIDLGPVMTTIEAIELLDAFLTDCAAGFGPHAAGWVRARDLHAAYAAWADATGRVRLSTKRLAAALVGRGIAKRSSNGVLYQISLRHDGPPAPLAGGER